MLFATGAERMRARVDLDSWIGDGPFNRGHAVLDLATSTARERVGGDRPGRGRDHGRYGAARHLVRRRHQQHEASSPCAPADRRRLHDHHAHRPHHRPRQRGGPALVGHQARQHRRGRCSSTWCPSIAASSVDGSATPTSASASAPASPARRATSAWTSAAGCATAPCASPSDSSHSGAPPHRVSFRALSLAPSSHPSACSVDGRLYLPENRRVKAWGVFLMALAVPGGFWFENHPLADRWLSGTTRDLADSRRRLPGLGEPGGGRRAGAGLRPRRHAAVARPARPMGSGAACLSPSTARSPCWRSRWCRRTRPSAGCRRRWVVAWSAWLSLLFVTVIQAVSPQPAVGGVERRRSAAARSACAGAVSARVHRRRADGGPRSSLAGSRVRQGGRRR